MKSRRILHVANFGFKPVKVYLHNTANKLSNGWIRAGHHVINFSDRDIARWNSFLGSRKFGGHSVNRLLLDACRNFQPDVVAFGHADIVTPGTLAEIKTLLPQAKMLQWNVDWLVPLDHALSNDPTAGNNKAKLLSKRDLLDATFITTAGNILQEIATPAHVAAFLPNPVDHSIEQNRNFETESLPHDVFFPSNSEDDRRFHCGAWRGMGDFTRAMQLALPDMSFLTPGINDVPKVFGPKYQEAICQCRTGLNISRRNDSYLYSSDRLAHLAGNGLAVCLDRATGYADIFSDDEMIFYASEEELFSRLARLKRDDGERRRIAERGWKRYGELFDSRIIAQYMLDVVYGEHDETKYSWPAVAKFSSS
jgi:hypothetical protein